MQSKVKIYVKENKILIKKKCTFYRTNNIESNKILLQYVEAITVFNLKPIKLSSFICFSRLTHLM